MKKRGGTARVELSRCGDSKPIASYHHLPSPPRAPSPIGLWGPKKATLNSALCTSAPSSYNMVHPCLIKLGTFSNLRMKERGRKRGKERGSHRVGYTASLYPVRNAFHDTWLEHHKLITPAFSKLLFFKIYFLFNLVQLILQTFLGPDSNFKMPLGMRLCKAAAA